MNPLSQRQKSLPANGGVDSAATVGTGFVDNIKGRAWTNKKKAQMDAFFSMPLRSKMAPKFTQIWGHCLDCAAGIFLRRVFDKVAMY